MCSADFLRKCSCALDTENHGLVAGLKLAESLLSSCIIYCSDSVEAIWAIQSGQGVPGNSSQVAMQGMQLLFSNPRWVLHHIGREDNKMADFMARRERGCSWS